MRAWVLLLAVLVLATQVGCYASQLPTDSDAGADWDSQALDGQTLDGQTLDGQPDSRPSLGDAEPDGPMVEGRLRNTFLLLRNWVIEERRIDDPSVIVEAQELPERLGASSIIRDDEAMLLAATEHGFLFQYHPYISPNIYVFDRRRGWSMHNVPEPQFLFHQAVIRNGWLYPAARHAGDDQLYRFHIEDGRFEEVELEREFRSRIDGLDGHVVSLGAPMWAWEFEPAQQTFVKSHIRGEVFPYEFLWPSLRMTATVEGALPYCRFGIRADGGHHEWALLQPDESSIYRTTQEALRPPAHGNIVPTVDNRILFFSAHDRLGRWEEREADITLYRMDASFENLEVLLEGRFGWPVEIALGDPVERVVAARR